MLTSNLAPRGACSAVVLALLCVLATGTAAAEPQSASLPTYWRYAHPEAKVLAGFDVRGMMNSPLGQKLAQDFKAVGSKWSATARPGDLDLFQGIERVLISAPADAMEASGTASRRGVITLQGAFDLAKLRKVLSSRGEKKAYRGVELWTEGSPAGGRADGMVGLVSPQVVLIGDGGSIKAAIDHHASADGSIAYDPVWLRATELAPLYEMWFVGNMPPKKLSGENADPYMGPLAVLDGVDSFEAGLSMKQGVQLQFNLNTASPAEASKLAQGLAGMMMLAQASQSGKPEMGELLNRVKFGSAGAQVQVSAAWTQPEIETGWKQMQARIGQATGMAPVPVRPAASGVSEWNVNPNAAPRAAIANAEPSRPVEPPAPAGPLTVKILNADGGNQEVVIKPAKP